MFNARFHKYSLNVLPSFFTYLLECSLFCDARIARDTLPCISTLLHCLTSIWFRAVHELGFFFSRFSFSLSLCNKKPTPAPEYVLALFRVDYYIIYLISNNVIRLSWGDLQVYRHLLGSLNSVFVITMEYFW